MKNWKKILILTVLCIAVVGFTLSSANAAKTEKLYFKKGADFKKEPSTNVYKKIDSKNDIEGTYIYPQNKKAQIAPNTLYMRLGQGLDDPGDYKATKVVVKFKKTANNKNYYSTKIFYSNAVYYQPKNDYKPLYTVYYYEKLLNFKTDKLYFKKGIDFKENPSAYVYKKIDSKNDIEGSYTYPESKDAQIAPNTLYMRLGQGLEDIGDYIATKVVVQFKKTLNNKNYYSTKIFYSNAVYYQPKNDYKPLYVVYYYKKLLSPSGDSATNTGYVKKTNYVQNGDSVAKAGYSYSNTNSNKNSATNLDSKETGVPIMPLLLLLLSSLGFLVWKKH